MDRNAKRRAEEKEGHVRCLCPEYQTPEESEIEAGLPTLDLPSVES